MCREEGRERGVKGGREVKGRREGGRCEGRKENVWREGGRCGRKKGVKCGEREGNV